MKLTLFAAALALVGCLTEPEKEKKAVNVGGGKMSDCILMEGNIFYCRTEPVDEPDDDPGRTVIVLRQSETACPYPDCYGDPAPSPPK